MSGTGSRRAPAIEVEDLTKHYGNLLAVDHIGFRAEQGELFGFLGPNGAGKTTTLRMLTGIIRADGGSASVAGCRAGSLRAKQVSGVLPEMANANSRSLHKRRSAGC